jgi:hypothetical protein
MLLTQPHLAPRLKSRAIPPLLWASVACCTLNLPFTAGNPSRSKDKSTHDLCLGFYNSSIIATVMSCVQQLRLQFACEVRKTQWTCFVMSTLIMPYYFEFKAHTTFRKGFSGGKSSASKYILTVYNIHYTFSEATYLRKLCFWELWLVKNSTQNLRCTLIFSTEKFGEKKKGLSWLQSNIVTLT